jgi:glycosyltransferase involved in cell wall biosynthesis
MNPIHFSVVTVVHLDLEGLQRTRKSLEQQDYANWTHIIIDSGKNAELLKYIKSLSAKNTKFISENDTGIYNAMNKGWKLANNKSYVLFLNAQDVFCDQLSLVKASETLTIFGQPSWGCTTHEEIEVSGEKWVCKLVSPPSLENQLYAFGYRSHQSVLMKKDFIESLNGFDEQFRLAADWEMIARAFKKELPVEWSHSLGKFQLGGISTTYQLESHRELRKIREMYLITNFWKRLLDDFWCAAYLRHFGYRNYFYPLIVVFLPRIKDHSLLAQLFLGFRKIIDRLKVHRRILRNPTFRLILQKLSERFRRYRRKNSFFRSLFFARFLKLLNVFISRSTQNEFTITYRKYRIRKIVRSLRYFTIKKLHCLLGIQPYSAPQIKAPSNYRQ